MSIIIRYRLTMAGITGHKVCNVRDMSFSVPVNMWGYAEPQKSAFPQECHRRQFTLVVNRTLIYSCQALTVVRY